MPTPPLTHEAMQQAVDALRDHGTQGAAARSLGIPLTTFTSRLRRAREEGLMVDPAVKAGMDHVGTRMVPAGMWVKTPPTDEAPGYSLYLRPGAPDPVDMVALIADHMANIPPAPSVEAPQNVNPNYVAFFPRTDWHLGASVTADVAGIPYNRQIAVDRLRAGFSALHAAIPASETAIILGNGDDTHSNDDRDVTPRSQHKLKVEGSHYDNVEMCIDLTAWQIDMALQKHGSVIVKLNPGNHDPNTPGPITFAMQQRYRSEPRVTVMSGQSPFFVFQRDDLFIVTHHGHGLKPKEMALTIPYKFREQFSRAKRHYFITGHLHFDKADTFGGLRWIQLPSICSLEQHGAEMGFSDNSGMVGMWFNTNGGAKSEIAIAF